MQQSADIMGMHVTVEIKDEGRASKQGLSPDSKGCDLVFNYLRYIDEKFSTYKATSEISKINRGELAEANFSTDMLEILSLAEATKRHSQGYFDIKKTDGSLDPSGVVKGWAIWQASLLLQREGFKYFFIDVGGDIQARVANPQTQSWRVGIRNPFNNTEIVKVLQITSQGVATSGSYERGQHIYNPHQPQQPLTEILSITVIGPNIYEADRFATAAFAMGPEGINFIESLPQFEAYQINQQGTATMTSGFDQFVTT